MPYIGAPCEPQLQVVTPDRISALTGGPALTVDQVVPVPIGGDWWLAGRMPGTNEAAVAGSPDGREWTVTALPTPDAPEPWVTIGGAGAVRYAAVTSHHVIYGQALRGLHRSDDGGQTWTLVYQPDPVQPMISTAGSPAVGPDGQVTLGSETEEDVHVSTDGGRTFTLDPDLANLWSIRLTRGGYLTPDGGSGMHLSREGAGWRTLDFGLG